jgi:predicted ATPase
LDIYGEHEYTLPPMSVPPHSDEYSAEEIINYEAVQLFISRTRQHQPDFEVTAETAASIVEICQQLDGLPLALELAAARLRDMPVDALAEALRQASGQDWLALLRWSVRDLPPRQRTLFNAIAWSYMLLEPEQQDMFRQLSVFSGSFDWSAIVAILDIPALENETALRASLGHLVDHNLVSLASRVPERWHLLEMIREFAQAELDTKEVQIVRQRHAICYLAKLTTIVEDLTSTDYLAEFIHEENNGRAALHFALDAADATLAQQLVNVMAGYWEQRGLLDEGRRYLETVLNMVGAVDDSLRIANLHRATNLAWMQHDFPAAEEYISSALELARKRKDTYNIVKLINLQSRIYLEEGYYRQADLVLNEGLQMESSLPEQITTPFMLIQQGEAAFALGDLDRAEILTKRGLKEITSEDSIPYCMGWTNLAEIALARRDIVKTHQALLQALPVVHIHNRRERIFLNAVAGLLLIQPKSPERSTDVAVQLLSNLQKENERLGDPLSPMVQRQISERVDRARKIVPPNRWQTLWEKGQRWTAAESIAIAKEILS